MNETYQERTKHLNLQINRVSKHNERDFTWKFFDHVAFELMFVFVVERDKFFPDWFIRCWRHIVSNRIWLVFFRVPECVKRSNLSNKADKLGRPVV